MMKINNIPIRTVNNYNVNDFEIDDNLVIKNLPDIANISITGEREKITLVSCTNFKLLRPINNVMDAQVENNANINLAFEINKDLTTPLCIDMSKNEQIASNIQINILQSVNAKIIVKLANNKLEYNNSRIMLNVQQNAKLDIAFLYDLDATNFVSIQGNLDDNSQLNCNIFDFCSKVSAFNVYFNLSGDLSTSSIKTVYFGEKNSKLDINYLNEIYGKKSNANIDVVGALTDNGKKTFKGTIDFKKGCKKSYGSENEFCTLLSSNAKSIAVPILLCTEEDVDGKHSTATGKIDDKQMFYLMSRGLNEKEAQKLIIKTKFNTVINNLFDDKLKQTILEIIDRKFE